MKLHQKLFIHAFLGHLIISIILFIILYFVTSSYFEKTLTQRSKSEARAIFKNLYQGMLKGYSKEELDKIVENFNRENVKVVLEIPKIIKRDQASQEEFISKLKGGVHYKYYLVAKDECLKCHQVEKGQILGILEIRMYFLEELKNFSQLLILLLLFLSVVILAGVYFIGRVQGRKISSSLSILENRIKSAQSFEDLIKREKFFETPPIIEIEEIEVVNKIFEELLERVKKLAVDKKVLYFQISLLEKFILTSELIKDWKYYILKLLEEINNIVKIPFIFALFYIEDEIFEADCFWFESPTESLKKKIEEKLKGISSEKLGKIFLNFAHYSVYEDRNFIENNLFEVRIKKAILDLPSIGGIVGAGISYTEIDYTKEIAIEAVLSSLLNVIGSVKAIHKYTKELEFYATRDSLTSLYNQRVFWELLTYEIERAKRYNYKFAVLLLDLDNFKIINDTYGHLFGDQFLKEMASLLEKNKRKGDILARYGGDEFVFILPLCDLSQAVSVAERIRENLKVYKIKAPDGKELSITTTISIVIFPDHAETPKDLFAIADTLLYKSKMEGKSKIVFPTTEEILSYQKEILSTTFMIKEAVENKHIIPYFQPIFELKNKDIFGYEVLMRIETKDEILPAGRFIHLAETLGLIHEMDFIVMEKALEKTLAKNYNGKLFFNLSPKEIIIPDYLPKLVKLVDSYKYPRENIVFEITERETVKNLKLLEKFIRELQELGFLFCIDDFGSGFSSFQYIRHFLINIIKMEGEFVLGLAKRNLLDLAIVESIIALCKRVNIKIIAEYVENEEIIERLKELGVDFGQGFYLGKPSPELL